MKIPGQPYAYCNRPHTAFTIPVTLQHPLLGKFVDECETYEPNKNDNTFVSELSEMTSQLAVPEQTRQNDFRQCFFDYTGIQLQTGPVGTTAYSTDGHATVRDYLFVLTEGPGQSSPLKARPSPLCRAWYTITSLSSTRSRCVRRSRVRLFHVSSYSMLVSANMHVCLSLLLN
jgi:hypothetical protein